MSRGIRCLSIHASKDLATKVANSLGLNVGGSNDTDNLDGGSSQEVPQDLSATNKEGADKTSQATHSLPDTATILSDLSAAEKTIEDMMRTKGIQENQKRSSTATDEPNVKKRRYGGRVLRQK